MKKKEREKKENLDLKSNYFNLSCNDLHPRNVSTISYVLQNEKRNKKIDKKIRKKQKKRNGGLVSPG